MPCSRRRKKVENVSTRKIAVKRKSKLSVGTTQVVTPFSSRKKRDKIHRLFQGKRMKKMETPPKVVEKISEVVTNLSRKKVTNEVSFRKRRH